MSYDTSSTYHPILDRSSTELDIHRPYHSESDPEYYHQEATYTPRPYGLSKLSNERLKCDRNLGWSIDWAVAFLVKHLENNASDVSCTLKKIRAKAQHLANNGLIQDVPLRTFNQLDQTLFAGHLKNAVYLDVCDLGPDVSGATFSHGRGPNPRVRRISIVLNTDVHQDSTPTALLASLIHHMIHAYFLVACGPQEEKEQGYGRLERVRFRSE
jgi:hypothetical protein